MIRMSSIILLMLSLGLLSLASALADDKGFVITYDAAEVKTESVLKCVVFSIPNCPACVKLKSGIVRELLPIGWPVTFADATEPSEFTKYADLTKGFPQSCVLKDGERIAVFFGYMPPAKLAGILNSLGRYK